MLTWGACSMIFSWLAYDRHAHVEFYFSHIGRPIMHVYMYLFLKTLDTLNYLNKILLQGHMEDDFILKRAH